MRNVPDSADPGHVNENWYQDRKMEAEELLAQVQGKEEVLIAEGHHVNPKGNTAIGDLIMHRVQFLIS